MARGHESESNGKKKFTRHTRFSISASPTPLLSYASALVSSGALSAPMCGVLPGRMSCGGKSSASARSGESSAAPARHYSRSAHASSPQRLPFSEKAARRPGGSQAGSRAGSFSALDWCPSCCSISLRIDRGQCAISTSVSVSLRVRIRSATPTPALNAQIVRRRLTHRREPTLVPVRPARLWPAVRLQKQHLPGVRQLVDDYEDLATPRQRDGKQSRH